MNRIDGQILADRIRQEVGEEVETLSFRPHLAVLLVGDDPASQLYVNLKKKLGEEIGMNIEVHHLEANMPDDQLEELIRSWNQDEDIDGILIQIPLPPGHDEVRVLRTMDPQKDVDGFHPDNPGIPPLHEGILRLVATTPLHLDGAKAVILANSDVFANPLNRLLTTAGAFVTIMDPDALVPSALKEADLVVIAIGRYNFLTPDMVKDDVVIIDVGTNRLPDNKIRGDAAFSAFKETTAWITPVPGGVGPMTIAMLLKSLLEFAKRRRAVS
jgi:methylenetetrahydrofolate dehydrogenase (NADP+)/methenyltetrahydrofolate cyclohydrolase